MTQAPATPELVEALEAAALAGWSYDVYLLEPETAAAVAEAHYAAALEAQQARIAELEVENERLRLTMLGGEDVAGFASSLPLAQVLDSFRTYETALRDSANSAQALADRYEKALRLAERELSFAVERMDRRGGSYEAALTEVRQALSSSQGRREGGEL